MALVFGNNLNDENIINRTWSGLSDSLIAPVGGLFGGSSSMGELDMVMYGPMQLIAVGFPGNEFSGEVLPAIRDVKEKGLIRVIDYAFVIKDADGNMLAVEATDF